MSEFFTFNIGTRLTFTKLKASWNDVISINPQLSKVNLNSEALTTTISMKLRPSNKIQINTVLSSGLKIQIIVKMEKIEKTMVYLLFLKNF